MSRGWLKPGQFHLIIHVWIKNDKGKYLISKRVLNKRWPNLWGCTIGSAIAGDSSIKTALKETKEELGLALKGERGKLLTRHLNFVNDSKDCGEFIDIWLFEENVNLKQIIFKEDETCDAKWATKKEIDKMIKENKFIPKMDLPFYDNL